MQITLYTDGACDIHAENQPGGWAAILQAADENGTLLKETVLSGGAEATTNNRMELTAVIESLKILSRPAKLRIYTDSRYVIDIAAGKKKVTLNNRLWDEYFENAERHDIAWHYVAGHSGNALNERCDRLAVAERLKLSMESKESAATDLVSSSAINVYLSTQYNGKKKSTAWAAVIVRDGASQELCGRLSLTTELEGTLIGAIKALESLPAGESATLFTAQEYLSKGMNLWLRGWKARGWKTRGGEAVKYQAHWQDLAKLAAARELSFHFVKARAENPHFLRGKELAAETLKHS